MGMVEGCGVLEFKIYYSEEKCEVMRNWRAGE